MKKIRFFTPVMATVAALSPAVALLSSCGKINYTELVSEIKDYALSVFLELAKTTHRAVWDEGEIAAYIKKQMASYGYTEPDGEDYWSEIPEVRESIKKEINSKYRTDNAQRLLPDQPEHGKYFAEYGNMWYDLPASEGFENAPKLIISAHMDASMAFNSTADKETWINSTEKVINVNYDRDNEIIKTDGKTSLGADDGLGIATMLSIAKNHAKFKHGGIRLLFTAGESETTENYASGSDFLYNDQILGGYLNYEQTGTSYLAQGSKKPFGEKGEFPYIVSTAGIYKNSVYTSSAGIHDCEIADQELKLDVSQSEAKTYSTTQYDHLSNEIDWNRTETWEGETTPRKLNLYTIKIDNLHGGQSGKYINNGYVNALKMLTEMLFMSDYAFRIIEGKSYPGNRAIPSQAKFTFASMWTKDELQEKFNKVVESYKISFPNDSWSKFTLEFNQLDESEKNKNKWSFSPKQSRIFTKLCAYELQFGPLEWFDKDHASVKTSVNFADLDMKATQSPTNEFSHFHMHNVCRSADKESMLIFHNIAETLTYDTFSIFYEFRYDKTKEEEKTPYIKAKNHTLHTTKPIWERAESSKIIDLLCDGFRNQGINPTLWDNHGWVEIACVPRIYRDAFDGEQPLISCLGPEVRNSHEVDEEVWTDSWTTCLSTLSYVVDHIKNM